MDIFSLLDQIQAVARNGLYYSDNGYDSERYKRILNLSAEQYSELLDTSSTEIKQNFLAETGQITPKVGADAAIFDEAGRILLMERVDDTGWCLPCGWVEAGEKPCQAAIRETKEETGLEVTISRLVGVFTRLPHQHGGLHTMIAVVHLCKIVGGSLELSHEGTRLKYCEIDAMDNWHATHEEYARAAHKMWQADGSLPSVSN